MIRSHLKACLLIASLVFIVYSSALSGQFLWDDEPLILKNPWIREARFLPQLFTHDLHTFARRSALYYRPLQSLTYVMDYALFKTRPWGYHLTTLFLHLLVGCLVYAVSCQLGFSSRQALLIALLFSLHPTLNASVAYISGRADSLVALFGLFSLWCFLRFVQTGAPAFYGLSFLLFILGLLSKEVALVLPVTFFLALRLFSKKKLDETLRLLSPFLLLIIGHVIGRFVLFGRLTAKVDVSVPLWHLALFSLKATLNQVKLIFLPFPLYMERYLKIRDPFWDLPTGLGFLFLVGLFALWWRNRSPRATFGWGWFWVFLLINSPLVLRINRYAEHALYLPLMGLGMVVVEGLSTLFKEQQKKRFWRWGMTVCLVGVIGGLSLKTYLRNQDWRDPETFYEMILRHNPESMIALNNLATISLEKGDHQRAEALLRKALELSPKVGEVSINLGTLLLRENRLEEAIQLYQRALAFNPQESKLLEGLASAHRLSGHCEEAVTLYQKAISLNPHLFGAHHFLAECYDTLGRSSLAEKERAFLHEQGIVIHEVTDLP